MPQRCVVLLRGINVGRGNRLPMAQLREHLAVAGCTDVRTYLQSGNAVVTAALSGLGDRVRSALPRDIPVVVLSAEAFAAVVVACPWPDAAANPKLVHVAFMDRRPSSAARAALEQWDGSDEIVIGADALYLKYTSSSLDSPLTPLIDPVKLGVTVTTRNWRTVTAIRELL